MAGVAVLPRSFRYAAGRVGAGPPFADQRGLLVRTRGKVTRNVGLHVSERGQTWLAEAPLQDLKQEVAAPTQAELRHRLSCLSKVHDGLAEVVASKMCPDGPE